MDITDGAHLEPTFIPFAAMALMPFAVALAKKGWISQWLLISNILIFAYMEILWMASPGSRLALDGIVYFNSSEPLSLGLVTSMFVHADVLHLLGNMLVLYFIGVSLEERIGTNRIMAIFLITGLVSTFGYALFRWGEDFRLVGASGAVSGLMGAMLVLYPRDEIPMIVGPIFLRRVPVWIAVGAFFSMEVVLTLLVQSDTVAHAAHVIGLVSGVALCPLLAKRPDMGAPSKRREGEVRLAEALARIATTNEARQAADMAVSEDIEEVRRVWIAKALELARCPKCSGGVRASGGGLECIRCGARF